MSELVSADTLVVNVAATDRDSGLNGKISYRLLSSPLHSFYIQTDNGKKKIIYVCVCLYGTIWQFNFCICQGNSFLSNVFIFFPHSAPMFTKSLTGASSILASVYMFKACVSYSTRKMRAQSSCEAIVSQKIHRFGLVPL